MNNNAVAQNRSESTVLRELKRRISDHFYNEAEIMKDILEADLSDEDCKELQRFMLNHPFSQVIEQIKAVRQKKKKTH